MIKLCVQNGLFRVYRTQLSLFHVVVSGILMAVGLLALHCFLNHFRCFLDAETVKLFSLLHITRISQYIRRGFVKKHRLADILDSNFSTLRTCFR